MKIEIWSDVMCPFCYIGKQSFEKALQKFEHAKNIEVIWKSYQLDPTIPTNVTDSYVGYVAKKRNLSEVDSYKMMTAVEESAKAAGVTIDFSKTVMTNSLNAHKLIQFAKTKNKGNEIEERLFEAFFSEGKNVSDLSVLTLLGKDIGLVEEEITQAFSDDFYAYQVKQDSNEAIEIGVTGVPFFVLDRKYGVSGAQPETVFLESITKAYNEWQSNNAESKLEITNGESCDINGNCD